MCECFGYFPFNLPVNLITLFFMCKYENMQTKKGSSAEIISTSDQQRWQRYRPVLLSPSLARYFLSTPEFPLGIVSEIPRLWRLDQPSWSGSQGEDTTTLRSASGTKNLPRFKVKQNDRSWYMVKKALAIASLYVGNHTKQYLPWHLQLVCSLF